MCVLRRWKETKLEKSTRPISDKNKTGGGEFDAKFTRDPDNCQTALTFWLQNTKSQSGLTSLHQIS